MNFLASPRLAPPCLDPVTASVLLIVQVPLPYNTLGLQQCLDDHMAHFRLPLTDLEGKVTKGET